MLARCARCQGTFTTETFGVQTCPHCGSEIHLADPSAPPAAPPAAGPGPTPPPGAAPPPAWGAPPEPPPPPPGFGPPPGGYGPPPGYGPPGGYGQPPGGWGPPPYGPPGAVPGGELPSPWADRKARGLFAAFFETFKLVAVQPSEFFRRVRIDQTGAAVLFGVIAATVGSAAAAVYGYFSGAASLAAMQQLLQGMPEEQARIFRLFAHGLTAGATVAQIVLAPLIAVIAIYLNAAVIHLLLMLFKGAARGFDATLTVVAYGTGLQLLLALPGCGSLVAAVWFLVVLIVGLGEAHRCGPGKAAAAVFTPVALACVCCACALGLGGATLMKGLQQAADAAKDTTNL